MPLGQLTVNALLEVRYDGLWRRRARLIHLATVFCYAIDAFYMIFRVAHE